MTLLIFILVAVYLLGILSMYRESKERVQRYKDSLDAQIRIDLARAKERRILAELSAPKQYHIHQHIHKHDINIDKAVILEGEDHGRKNCGRTSLHSD